MLIRFRLTIAVLAATLLPCPLLGQVPIAIDIEREPFRYSVTAANNRVSRLQHRLQSGEAQLEYSSEYGYLRSLLRELQIPESSQALVFSKTSLQVQHISRRNPRAIYFNDDTYVGWVHGSSLVEISTSDPKLGAAFYTFQMSRPQAKLRRADYQCLACHATSMTQGIPGHTVRSIHPTYDGGIDAQKPSYVTDDTSPFSQRWGGWYVTGTHGSMQHMGNAFLRGGILDTKDTSNLSSLRDFFDSSNYLLPYSDIRALMILEHQTQMHNAFTLADFSVRKLQYDARDLPASAEEERERHAQLQLIASPVVERMLFRGEFLLTDEVQGSVLFEQDFVSRGPVDSHGRSLREFDMKTRMFKYPLSYLIYSEAFDALQTSLREEILRQLTEILSSHDDLPDYPHLDRSTRADTLAILRATKPGV